MRFLISIAPKLSASLGSVVLEIVLQHGLKAAHLFEVDASMESFMGQN